MPGLATVADIYRSDSHVVRSLLETEGVSDADDMGHLQKGNKNKTSRHGGEKKRHGSDRSQGCPVAANHKSSRRGGGEKTGEKGGRGLADGSTP